MSNLLGDVLWKQESNSTILEITTPIVLPAGIKAKQLNVAIYNENTLIVKYQDAHLLQWNLLYPVESQDIEWSYQEGNIHIELRKMENKIWTQLISHKPNLNGTTDLNNPFLLSDEMLNAMIANEWPSLPRDVVNEAIGADNAVDDVLNLAIDEIDKKPPVVLPLVSRIELLSMTEQLSKLTEQLSMFQEQIKQLKSNQDAKVGANTESNSDTEPKSKEKDELNDAEKKCELVEKMVGVQKEILAKRAGPTSLQLYFEVQQLEIKKTCYNYGVEYGDTEQYGWPPSDNTKTESAEVEMKLTAIELYEMGKSLIELAKEDQDKIREGIHYLRLAALQHNHPQATILLFQLYIKINRPERASYLIIRRARMSDCEPTTNALCASLHEEGGPLFAPLRSLSIYYHQRAALSGFSNAMLALCDIFKSGCTPGMKTLVATYKDKLNITEETDAELLISKSIDGERFLWWCNHAESLGAGPAYYIKYQLHSNGEFGVEKSYCLAEKYWNKCMASFPELASLNNFHRQRLAQLKKELQPVPENESKPSQNASMENQITKKEALHQKMSEFQHLSKPNLTRAQVESLYTTAKKGKLQPNWRKYWEGMSLISISIFSIYTLLFPLRVQLFPVFVSACDSMKQVLVQLFGAQFELIMNFISTIKL